MQKTAAYFAGQATSLYGLGLDEPTVQGMLKAAGCTNAAEYTKEAFWPLLGRAAAWGLSKLAPMAGRAVGALTKAAPVVGNAVSHIPGALTSAAEGMANAPGRTLMQGAGNMLKGLTFQSGGAGTLGHTLGRGLGYKSLADTLTSA